MRIRISRNGEVIVSSSENMPHEEIRKLVESKEKWICRHLERFAGEREALDPMKSISLNGRQLRVELTYSGKLKNNRASFLPEEGLCIITGPNQDRDSCLNSIKRALRKAASGKLSARLRELSVKTGIIYLKLYIRDQKTRWGSSSGRGNISLNWRVIMLAPEIQDYLIIHELCHQKNFNHSSSFWDSVGHFCPDYKELNRALKEQQGIMSLFR